MWKAFAVRETASPKLWMDAYLAAFALAGRFRMVTTDAAFRKVQPVPRTVQPLLRIVKPHR